MNQELQNVMAQKRLMIAQLNQVDVDYKIQLDCRNH